MNTLFQNSDPDKIVRRKLSEQVLDRLTQMIRTGELRPGDHVPSERALMDRFGVGRPAVREALQSLHNSGLITITHGERSRVNALDLGAVLDQTNDLARVILSTDPDTLDHLKSARRMFEMGMVRMAIERATAADIADLRALVDEQGQQMNDAMAFIRADMAFHARLAQITQNPIIQSVSQAMLGWLFEHHISLLHWSGKENVTLQEHRQIVDLIAERRVGAAVTAMAQHLDRAADAFGAKS